MANQRCPWLIFLVSVFSVGFLFIGGASATEPASLSDGEVVSVTPQNTASADGSVEITVETAHSASTIVEVEGSGFDVDLSADNEIETVDNQIRFIDPNRAGSTYTVTVAIDGGEAGDTGSITVWTNSEELTRADDQSSSSFVLESTNTGDEFEDRAFTAEQYNAVFDDGEDTSQDALSDAINQWFTSPDNTVNGTQIGQDSLSDMINYWFNNLQ